MPKRELGKIEDGNLDSATSEKNGQDLSSAEKQKERMETKLYVARDVEGEPNRKELEIIKKELELSKCAAFIGIAPFGSVVSGYSEKGASDIDVFVVYDVDKFETAEEKQDFLRKINFPRVYETEKGRFKVEFNRIGISLNSIIDDIRCGNLFSSDDIDISDITRIITGDKIKTYREKIAVELQRLPLGSQQEIAGMIVGGLVKRDRESLRKRTERMPGLAEEQHEEILTKRKEMWKKRVKKIWGIEPNDD